MKDNEKLRANLDDLENRSRRNNIHVIGIPEGTEALHPSAFIETLLLKGFEEQSFTRTPEVDRAHCSLAPLLKPNQSPMPFNARMHHYQMRELILRLARYMCCTKERVFTFTPISALRQ